MKTVLLTFSLFFGSLFLMSQSCNKKVQKCTGNVICTELFAMATVHVTDNNGQDVILNDAYTIRNSTNEVIRIEQTMPNGTYIVLDDSYLKKLQNQADTFRFIGIKNSKEVVNELYVITADCCHINKRSGAESVTIK